MEFYQAGPIREFCVDVARMSGVSEEDASILADNLLFAQMRGMASHGLYRLRHYALRVKKGLCSGQAAPEIVSDAPSAIRVDGRNGLGCVVASKVMDICIDRAKTQGACFAAVFNGNHFGAGAQYVIQAAKKGMLGIIMSNTVANTVIYGGREPLLGTNPLGISLPLREHEPLVLDMATTEIAKGKIRLAAATGRRVPPGCGIDKEGNSTTDPAKIMDGGFLLPFGGAKGSGISLIIDMLCTALSGAVPSVDSVDFWDNDKRQDVGFFMGAIDLESFGPMGEYYQRADAEIERVRNSQPAVGFDRVYYPGEIEQLKYEDALKNGVPVEDVLIEDWTRLAEEYGLVVPFVK